MISYILIKIIDNFYCFDVNNVERVIELPNIVSLPESGDFVDGIMTYDFGTHENKSLKVINFRKLINENTLKEEIFSSLNSIQNSLEKSKNLDNLSKDFKIVNTILSKVYPKISSNQLLAQHIHNILLFIEKSSSIKIIDEISSKNLLSSIEIVLNNLGLVSSRFQKGIIINQNGEYITLSVDEIEKIIHIDEDLVHEKNKNGNTQNHNIEIKGLVEVEGKLVYIVESIKV